MPASVSRERGGHLSFRTRLNPSLRTPPVYHLALYLPGSTPPPHSSKTSRALRYLPVREPRMVQSHASGEDSPQNPLTGHYWGVYLVANDRHAYLHAQLGRRAGYSPPDLDEHRIHHSGLPAAEGHVPGRHREAHRAPALLSVAGGERSHHPL